MPCCWSPKASTARPAALDRLDGKTVTTQGYPLLRDGLTVLQTETMPREMRQSLPPPAASVVGSRTLTGEIVDSKCFLGAINPGEGEVNPGMRGALSSRGISPRCSLLATPRAKSPIACLPTRPAGLCPRRPPTAPVSS